MTNGSAPRAASSWPTTTQGDDDGEPLTAEDRLDALALRAGGSVWSVFHAPTRDATAAEVSADALADRLAALTGEPLGNAERSAILAALAGYGSGAELAGALGIGAGAARERLRYGREKLRQRFPSADALADALADAQRLGAADDDPRAPRLGAADRAALTAVERTRRTAYRGATLRTGALPGRVGIAGEPPALTAAQLLERGQRARAQLAQLAAAQDARRAQLVAQRERGAAAAEDRAAAILPAFPAALAAALADAERHRTEAQRLRSGGRLPVGT